MERTGASSQGGGTGKTLDGPFDLSILWKSERHSVFVTLAGTVLLLFRAL